MDQARAPVVAAPQIAYLEQKYGVRLLNRTTRKLSMTDAGRALTTSACAPSLASSERADLELSLQAEAPAAQRAACG